MKKNFKTIRNTVWIYFAIFIVSIIALLWFSFGVSLESTYKRTKTKNIFETASYILTGWSQDEFTTDNLDLLAYDNDMCILIQDAYGNGVYSYDMMANNCLVHGIYSAGLYRYRAKAVASSSGIYYAEVKNPRFNSETETLAETLNYAAAEISKVDSLRRDLIANISHDLRTPLTMVKAYAEMIRDLSGDNPAKRSEHVNIIIEESDRLAALVNDILDLSKLESGSEGLNLSKFSITKKIHEIMGRYTLLSEQQGYSFYVNAETDFETEADIIKIEQVLYNLINNAVNYTGENKNVYINLLIKDKDTARIEITDTGKGIEPDLLPLIFDRYYRAEKNKREVIGTGLGLSIVKQILKRHNFKFGVRSEIGAGSTFWFEVKGRAVEEKGEKEKNGLSEN